MMNIDETRELGLQLCNILGIDSKDFTNWCDKVGNHWLDTPLYSMGNHYYGFETFHTYNDEKPWSISFQIMNSDAKQLKAPLSKQKKPFSKPAASLG